MKQFIALLFIFTLVLPGVAQNQYESDDAYYKALNLSVGYNYSFGEANDKDFHLLDVGLNKTHYGGRHGGGYQYGVATEIALNTQRFTIGPKISGVLYYQFIALGSELVAYTDFENVSLRFVPFIGIGGEKFKLTINPQIVLSNTKFQPVNKGLVSFTVNLSLERKKVE